MYKIKLKKVITLTKYVAKNTLTRFGERKLNKNK